MLTPITADDAAFTAVVATIDALIAEHPEAAPMLRTVAEHRTRTATYPALVVEDVTDDGETFPALRCPWCDTLTSEDEDDGLTIVDTAERWTRVSSDEHDHDRHTISPRYDGHGDYEGSHYKHGACGNPVDLPEGWTEL